MARLPVAAAREIWLLRNWREDPLDMISLPVWPVGWVLGRWGGAHPPAMGASGDGEGENASGGGVRLELFLPRVAT